MVMLNFKAGRELDEDKDSPKSGEGNVGSVPDEEAQHVPAAWSHLTQSLYASMQDLRGPPE